MRSLSLPTSRADLRLVGRTVGRVLGQPVWFLFAVVAGVLTVTLFVALNAPVYVQTVVITGELSFLGRLRAMWGIFPLVGASDHLVRDVLIYATAAAVGTNMAVLGYHLRRDRVRLRDSSSGVAGIVIGTLGAGCAPCGAAILAGLLSVTGVATGLAALPFEGAEFLLVALSVALLSLYWAADGARAGAVEGCPVDP